MTKNVELIWHQIFIMRDVFEKTYFQKDKQGRKIQLIFLKKNKKQNLKYLYFQRWMTPIHSLQVLSKLVNLFYFGWTTDYFVRCFKSIIKFRMGECHLRIARGRNRYHHSFALAEFNLQSQILNKTGQSRSISPAPTYTNQLSKKYQKKAALNFLHSNISLSTRPVKISC